MDSDSSLSESSPTSDQFSSESSEEQTESTPTSGGFSDETSEGFTESFSSAELTSAGFTSPSSTSSTSSGGYTETSPSSYSSYFPWPPPVKCCECDCEDGPGAGGSSGNGSQCSTNSKNPIRYDTGEIQFTESDLAAGGFGIPWGHSRQYRNQLGDDVDFGNGYNWFVAQWPYAEESDDTITVVRAGSKSLWFDLDGSTYVGRYGVLSTLFIDGEGVHVASPGGDVQTYHDFSAGAVAGKLKQVASPGGQFVSLEYDTGRLTTVTRSVTVDGVETTDSFEYTYGAGDHADRITSVTLRRRIGSDGAWSNVRRALYTYYDEFEADGNLGDLKTAVRQLPNVNGGWSDEGTCYYRYYKDAAGGIGFTHGLKYAFRPASFARLARAVGSPLTASDEQAARYADDYYEYDGEARVVTEASRGGTLTTLFARETNPGHFNGPNNWKTRTTETLPDGSQTVIFTNFLGQWMLKDERGSEGSGLRRISHQRFTADYKVDFIAEPSAVDMEADPIYDPEELDLAVQLRAHDGLIRVNVFYDGGDGPLNRLAQKLIKHGALDDEPILVEEFVYSTNTAGDVTVYPVSERIVYRNEDGSGDISTSYAYDFYASNNQLLQQTTTLPLVPTDQNGSNAADSQREQYDEQGYMTWEQGPKGFVDHFTYDLTTGALVQRIRDVNPSILPLPTVPATWTRPGGLPAPLHLITDYEVDDLGRTVQELGPVHEVGGQQVRTAQWTVYLDDEHETRTAQGYAIVSGTGYEYVLVNPVSITRRDEAGNVFDEIQAVRGCTGGTNDGCCAGSGPSDAPTEVEGRLTAGECFPQSSWTRWTHHTYDHAGRLIATRAYHTIPACGNGERGTNYDESIFGYDVLSRRNRTVSPGGTVTRTVIDAFNRQTATWVGTDDWGATDRDPADGTYPHASTTSSFDPALMSNLEFWGSGFEGVFQDDAGTIPAERGDPVACWKDRRADIGRFFHQADPAHQPSVSGNPVNGGRAVRFRQSGDIQYMLLDDSLFPADASAEATIFAVLRTTSSGSGYQRFIMKQSSADDYSLAMVRAHGGDGKFSTMSNKTGVVHQSADDSAATGTNQIRVVGCVWRLDGTYVALEFYRDGSLIATQPITEGAIEGAAQNTQGWSLGCELNGGNPVSGTDVEVAEFLIFSRALDAGELEDLTAWAQSLPFPVPPQTSNNMVPVMSRTYAEDCGCDEPHVVTAHVDNDPANDRITEFTYDYRNRLTIIAGEENFYEIRTYDNLDRVIQVERFDGPPNDVDDSSESEEPTNRLSRTRTHFDDQGRVYKTERFAVNSSGVVDEDHPLAENRWYDAAGNVAKVTPMGSYQNRAFTKSQYDGDGRNIGTYVGIFTGTLPESYADALTITSTNKIFEQAIPTYDAAGNTNQLTIYSRFHDATGGGILNLPTGAQPKARVSYSASWPDGVGRMRVAVDYGTNGNDLLERPAQPPERSDDVLVTTIVYNAAGRPFKTIDPGGRIAYSSFDSMGRTIKSIANYVGGAPGDDADLTVRQEYDSDGHLIRLNVCNPSTGHQITRYEYGVTLATGPIASNNILRATVYPDATDSGDRVVSTYNRMYERTTLTDQNDTRHRYEYDKLGRLTADCILEYGINIDDTVACMMTTYNARSLIQKVTTYNEAGDVLSQVERHYNSFDQLKDEWQSHNGPVEAGTPKVHYEYDQPTGTPNSNTARPAAITYPNGRTLVFDYGASDGDDERLSRLVAIADIGVDPLSSEDATPLVEYTYLGVRDFVRAAYPEPAVRWDIATGSGINPYAGWDRFGRTISCLWHNYADNVDVDHLQYGYDRVSNRIWRKNVVAIAGNDELYAYDGAQRLTDMSRGDLFENETAIENLALVQSWQLDAAGNWNRFLQVDEANSADNLNQVRKANQINEIVAISRQFGSNWITPQYDRAGNTIHMPQPIDPTSAFTATYDAWNRLITLIDENESEPVHIYAYDGFNRRITVDNNTTIRHTYYSGLWRWLEDRLDNSANAERQAVWGIRYIDDLVLRSRSPANDGSLSERLYAIQDANWNIISTIDATGDVQERYRYTPYGSPTFLDDAFVPRSPNLSAVEWETLFAGYHWNTFTRLYIARNRYLHSVIGVWLTRDPLGYASGDANLMRYAGGSPLSAVDPTGGQPRQGGGTAPSQTPAGTAILLAPTTVNAPYPGNSRPRSVTIDPVPMPVPKPGPGLLDRIKQAFTQAGTYEVEVPWGPCSIIVTITVKEEDADCCRPVDIGLNVNCSIKNKVVERLRKIPRLGPWIQSNSEGLPDISVTAWGEGSGKTCKKKNCTDFCSVSLNGAFTAGNGRRGGGKESLISVGASIEGNGVLNFCEGTLQLDWTGVVSVGINFVVDFLPEHAALNYDIEIGGTLLGGETKYGFLQWSDPC